jgi:hypothetical protein
MDDPFTPAPAALGGRRPAPVPAARPVDQSGWTCADYDSAEVLLTAGHRDALARVAAARTVRPTA